MGFLERNVGPGNKEVFSRLCNALVIPILEYAVPLVTILGWSSRQSRRTYLSLLKCYNTIHGVNDLNSNHYDYFEFYTTAHRRFVISTGSCTFIGLWKIPSYLFIPNCTRNHVITYTSCTRLSFITVVWIIDRILTLLTAYSGRLRHLSQRYAMNECQMLWSLKTHLQGTELKQITNQ